MLSLTDRRTVRALAVALPVAAGAAVLTAIGGASAAPSTPATRAAAPATGVAVVPGPRTTTLPVRPLAGAGPAAARAAAATAALPTFSGRFPYGGKTYRYTMVGTDPSQGAVTTKVKNTLTPVALKFGRTVVAPSSSVVRSVPRSALYKSAKFPGGTGQYGDVYLRTNFWSQINKGRKGWHVTLASPTVKRTLTFAVPNGKGGTARTKTGATVHLVDFAWLDGQLQSAATSGAADALTQFLGGEVVLCGSIRDLNSCGIGGYHSGLTAGGAAKTYSYQSYLSSKTFGASSYFYGLIPMSHELAEWLTDPYVNNVVPRWTQPSVPQYGCSTLLEVGDPLVGKVIKVGSAVFQDEAYLSFFTRRKPSTSWNGRYSWSGAQKTPSKSC